MASAMTPEQRVQQFLDMEAQQSNVDHEVLAWLTAANVDAKLLRSDLTAILATRAALAECEAERDEFKAREWRVRGGLAPVQPDNCTDCGRAMVWQREVQLDDDSSPGSWMCPNCVMRRCDSAEAKLADVTEDRDSLKVLLREAESSVERLGANLAECEARVERMEMFRTAAATRLAESMNNICLEFGEDDTILDALMDAAALRITETGAKLADAEAQRDAARYRADGNVDAVVAITNACRAAESRVAALQSGLAESNTNAVNLRLVLTQALVAWTPKHRHEGKGGSRDCMLCIARDAIVAAKPSASLAALLDGIVAAALSPSQDAKPQSATWPYVLAFAHAMEAKLAANRHKGDRAGWLAMPVGGLLARVHDEYEELTRAAAVAVQYPTDPNIQWVLDEAADVANFAMMVADKVGSQDAKTWGDV